MNKNMNREHENTKSYKKIFYQPLDIIMKNDVVSSNTTHSCRGSLTRKMFLQIKNNHPGE